MTLRLGSTWSTQDVSRALKEAGFTWKCVTNLAAEADPEKMRMYREMCTNRGYEAENYVFIDEVGTVRPVCGRWGRCLACPLSRRACMHQLRIAA
jgi:hypothetical protein